MSEASASKSCALITAFEAARFGSTTTRPVPSSIWARSPLARRASEASWRRRVNSSVLISPLSMACDRQKSGQGARGRTR
jgi:hypothetical protein